MKALLLVNFLLLHSIFGSAFRAGYTQAQIAIVTCYLHCVCRCWSEDKICNGENVPRGCFVPRNVPCCVGLCPWGACGDGRLPPASPGGY